MRVLLDAATVIAAIKGRLPVVLKLAKLKPGEVAVSVISRMEAESALRSGGKTNAKFAKLVQEFFAAIKVLEFGEAEAAQAVNLAPYLPQGEAGLGGYDLLLAATALAHKLTLVTATPKTFGFVPGLEVEKWL